MRSTTGGAGRPQRWATGLVAFLGLTVAVVAWLALRTDTYVATTRPAAHASSRPDLATAALARLERSLAARDVEAVAALAADPAAEAQLRAVAVNAGALHLTDVTARYVGGDDVRSGRRWTADVDLGWRLARFDAGAAEQEVRIGFTTVGDGGHESARITGLDGGARAPLWLTGPLTVTEGGRVLAFGPDHAAVSRYGRMARRAVRVVGRVVTGWNGPLVVEVPPSEGALDRTLGATAGSNTGVAAVTASVDGSSAVDAPVHVFVNPDVMGTLDARGAQVVMSHEATHAATRAVIDRSGPMWLTEGFADYVALRDVRLPLATTAGQVLDRVRTEGVPAHLPDRRDFDARSKGFGAAYEAAWLACRVLAEREGEAALVAVYERVGAGERLDAVLRDELGVGTRGLTRWWRQRLSDWAT